MSPLFHVYQNLCVRLNLARVSLANSLSSAVPLASLFLGPGLRVQVAGTEKPGWVLDGLGTYLTIKL